MTSQSSFTQPDWDKVLHQLQSYKSHSDEEVGEKITKATTDLCSLIGEYKLKGKEEPVSTLSKDDNFEKKFSEYLLHDFNSRKMLADLLSMVCIDFQYQEQSIVDDISGVNSALLMTLIELFAKSAQSSGEALVSLVDSVKLVFPGESDWKRVYAKAHLYNALKLTHCCNQKAHSRDCVVLASGKSLLSDKPLCLECLEKEKDLFPHIISSTDGVLH